MLIYVHEYHLFRENRTRDLNSDLIKFVDRATHGNYHRDSNATITLTDGTRLKVTDSVDEIRQKINGKS
jgi:hypothetical protein